MLLYKLVHITIECDDSGNNNDTKRKNLLRKEYQRDIVMPIIYIISTATRI